VFCSESFTKEENLLLCNILKNKYGLNARLEKRGKIKDVYRIILDKQSAKMLRFLIDPYLKKSCYYKFRSVKQK